ncbi:unnamed protein product [Rotaria sp. Silwood1]|nr:unnamed protein product [Rotaria sp. Silwood1]
MPFDDSIRIPTDDSVKILNGDSSVATGYYVPEDDLWFGMDITAWKPLTIDDKIKEKNTIIQGLKSKLKEARSKGKSVSSVQVDLANEKKELENLLERKGKKI